MAKSQGGSLLLRLLVLWLLISPAINSVSAQHPLDPYYEKFEGSVYRLPFDSLPKGYRSYVEFLVPEKHVSWDSLFVKPSNSKIPFPDVTYKELFGIIFHSAVSIPENGKYEFILASDDGSKLWINNRLIVDNDLPHGMRVRRDTITMKKGTYPVKIWYYQAYPTQYGLMFKSNYIGIPDYEIKDSLVWDSEILFDFDQYELNDQGMSILDSVVIILNDRPIDQVKILGHTDNVGKRAYNYELSQKRALSIKTYLVENCKDKQISMQAFGLGESAPRVPNDTSTNRAKNRRVELILK